MIARIVTWANAQWGLLAAQPNWDTELKVSMTLPTDVSKEPITFSESRRNFAQSARYTMEWTSYLSNSYDATEMRLFLNRVREVPVIVPMWPDACELPAVAIHHTTFTLVDLPARSGAFWIMANEDFSVFDIVQGSVNTQTKLMTLVTGPNHAYAAGDRIYPLIVGRLDERPQAEAITDETMELSFKVKEASAFSARITPVVSAIQTVGTNISEFASTLKWNVAPNHSRPLDWTEMPDIAYEQVGFLRYEQQRVYDHNTPRGQELEFYQSERTSIAKIEYFWRLTRATTLRFMIPTYRGDLRMLQDTPVAGHPTFILCERNFFTNPGRDPQLSDPYIALIKKDDSVTPFKVQIFDDVPGNKSRLVATGVTTVGVFEAATTIVSHLMLARFVEPLLEWTYTTPYLATTRIKFQELSMEYPNNIVPVPPPPLPEPAYLFIFNEVGIRTDRYTSYENNVLLSSGIYQGTYATAPFSFDTVKAGLKLDQEKLEIKSFKFTGNPLNRMWPFALDGILTLEIVEVNLNPAHPEQAASHAVSRFYGDVWSVDSEYKAVVIPFGNLFDRKFPRFLLSVSDNYTQFSPPTMLSPTAFKIIAAITGTVNHTSQTLAINSTHYAGKPVDYFAGGWLETGAGVNLEKRAILHSTAPVGNAMTLSIDRPLLKAATNQTLNLYPGYDGSIDQCETKFNNRINFGGHPFIPNVNPGVKAIKPKETQGGKKG